MKYKLIIVNWLVAWIPVCCISGDVFITLAAIAYFCVACQLLFRNEKGVMHEISKMEQWIDKLLNNKEL